MNNFGISVCFGMSHVMRVANANTAPISPSGAVTSDLGLALLHKIARG